jgi:small subunit ribosomal protein S21
VAAVAKGKALKLAAFTHGSGDAKYCRGPAAAGRMMFIWWRKAPVQVLVRDNNVDQALRALKKKMQREGVFREMKLRRNYEKPSERRAREKAEAVRRYRKLLRKRLEREGY